MLGVRAGIPRGRAIVMRKLFRRLTGALACLLFAAAAFAQQPFIVVASTTSTEQSGLFPQLLPAFEKDTGINVRVVAVGTGQAPVSYTHLTLPTSDLV